MQIKMKIIRLFSIFVRLSFIFSILIKDDPQVSLGTIQDSEMTSSDVDPILEYPQNFEMSSTDICINLKEMLLAFGSNSTDLYKTCDYSYHLLGYDNSVIKSAMPLCFLNIADVFCAFDIVFIKEKFDQNLKNKVLKNLNGCSKNSGKETLENYYKCPTLNHQTLLIEDEGEFCSKLESKSTEISDGNKNLEIENEESRVYTFVKKEVSGFFVIKSNMLFLFT